MKIMKQRPLNRFRFIFSLLLILALTGCGSAPSTEVQQQESTANTDMKTVITENMTTYQVTVPNISKDYNLLFLTDTHIVIPEKLGTIHKEIKNYSTQRLASFTEESGLVSSDLFTSWIDYANTEKPDALLLGGDIIDSPAPANIKYMDASLGKLQLPYVYTLGNHDWTYPWEYMTETGADKYLSKLSPYMDGNPVIHTQEFEDFLIVSVDNSSNQIHPDALPEYQKILAEGKPVILMLHVPLYTDSLFAKAAKVWSGGVTLGGGIHGGIYPDETSAEFIRLTTAKDSPVVLILAGHAHLEDKSDVTGEKNIPQIVGDAGYKGKGTLIHLTASR